MTQYLAASFSVLFPGLAFVLGLLASMYLFAEWVRYHRRPHFSLYWALALFLMYWFQVPVILSNLGKTIVQSEFNFFFAITFPITFVALVFIYLGVLDAIKFQMRPITKLLFGAWVISALIFFVQQFIVQDGVIQNHVLPLVGNIAFYGPIRTLIILTLVFWLRNTKNKALYGILGALAIIGESVIGLVRNFLIIKNVIQYPPEFWYIVLSGLDIFFILQTASIILLVAGFTLFTKVRKEQHN
ncbi:MAG: hypothetical protein A2919_00700 [Candidatus Spechtbacteria bacterium RIFCSPLOWO2_01_FULL_43_12]|uniref:Histidine kinase N-terminal 7TM region domain-containing protein n=1 Tax=Candidatus Spechtbacteria bacterium RIFCSPLOWO2_01_FULL_43_12 TaxID=1802162 RepID=A0A1G2HEV2_9BACT|nr:MAG: hypothetical protein A2919_00700 [Candidatus Spechtbacteria bacterium RIFCSPLOWO2_01_FULL_43_12]